MLARRTIATVVGLASLMLAAAQPARAAAETTTLHAHVIYGEGWACAEYFRCPLHFFAVEVLATDAGPGPVRGTAAGLRSSVFYPPPHGGAVPLTDVSVTHDSYGNHSFAASGPGAHYYGVDYPGYSSMEGCGPGGCVYYSYGSVAIVDIDLTPPPVVRPTAARNLTAESRPDGTVGLTWLRAESDTGPILHYNVYRGTAPGTLELYDSTAAVRINCLDPTVTSCWVPRVGNVDSYLDKETDPGTTYYYAVAAVNAFGEGPSSNEAAATTVSPEPPATVPGAPQDLNANASKKQGKVNISLSWKAPATDGGRPIDQYRIYRGTAAGFSSTTPYATVGATKLSFVDPAVARNTTYFYRVTAANSVGEGPSSNEATATTPK